MQTLTTAQTGTGASGSIVLLNNPQRAGWHTTRTLFIWGSWDGTTSIQLEVSPDNTNWFIVPGAVFTEPNTGTKVMVTVDLSADYARVNITAGTSFSLSAAFGG